MKVSEYLKDHEDVKFEEILNYPFNWEKVFYSNISSYENVLVDNTYADYLVYICWDNEEESFIYRVKKEKKVCKECGREYDN
jgi:hypothetical protein